MVTAGRAVISIGRTAIPRLTVWDGEGGKRRIWLNDRGEIDATVVKAFTWGQCHSLALALNQLGGFPIVAIADCRNSMRDPSHVVVRLPDVDYLDIIGRQAVQRAERKWGPCTLYDLSPETVATGLWSYLKPNVSIALPFAKTLLKQEGVT